MSCHFTYYVRNSCKILFAPFCCILSVVYLLSWVWLCNPMDYNQLGSLSMEFLRQEYWSGLPFPSPEDLPNPGTELTSLVSPALAARFFTTAPPGKNTHYSLWDHVSNYIGVRIGEFKFLEFTTFLCPNWLRNSISGSDPQALPTSPLD